jgi:hypothetical protein
MVARCFRQGAETWLQACRRVVAVAVLEEVGCTRKVAVAAGDTRADASVHNWQEVVAERIRETFTAIFTGKKLSTLKAGSIKISMG